MPLTNYEKVVFDDIDNRKRNVKITDRRSWDKVFTFYDELTSLLECDYKSSEIHNAENRDNYKYLLLKSDIEKQIQLLKELDMDRIRFVRTGFSIDLQDTPDFKYIQCVSPELKDEIAQVIHKYQKELSDFTTKHLNSWGEFDKKYEEEVQKLHSLKKDYLDRIKPYLYAPYNLPYTLLEWIAKYSASIVRLQHKNYVIASSDMDEYVLAFDELAERVKAIWEMCQEESE